MIFNFIKNKDKSVEVSNIDEVTDLIADKVNAKNDEVMSLTQENDKLRQDNAALILTKSDYQKKINNQDEKLKEARRIELVNSKEIDRLHKNQESLIEEYKKKIKDLSESGERQVDVIQEYSERIIELEEEVKKLKSNMRYSEIISLTDTCDKQLKFIEILQNIASAKADKTQLKDVFSHNLSIYLDNNFNTVKQASDKLGINRTTLSELKSGKTALSYDNLDILDSKMCEYFECSIYELVTVKLNKEDSQ